jgi:hypothetical protein
MLMINLTGLAPLAYHLVDVDDGATLVFRDASNACVGRVHPANPGAADDLWMAELGHLRVLTPYLSREGALGAVCAYAEANPQLAA